MQATVQCRLYSGRQVDLKPHPILFLHGVLLAVTKPASSLKKALSQGHIRNALDYHLNKPKSANDKLTIMAREPANTAFAQ